MVPTRPLRSPEAPPRPKRGFHRFWLVTLRPIYRATFGMRGHGVENLPARGPYIVASNHQSMMDWSFLAYFFPGLVRYVVHRDYYDHPVLGIAMRFNGAVPMRTDRPDLNGMRIARAVLAAGEPLIIFPEGGIARDGRPRRAFPGVIALAAACGVPVVPAAIRGANDVLPRDKWLPRPGLVSVSFGRPFPPPPKTDRGAQIVMSQRLMATIEALLDQRPVPPPVW